MTALSKIYAESGNPLNNEIYPAFTLNGGAYRTLYPSGFLGKTSNLDKEIKMKRKFLVLLAVLALVMISVVPAYANRGDGALGVVYVSSQGLYYDTFVSAQSLPMHGRFQKLDNGVTDFGPGDQGYVGGRWWIDDGNGIMDENDTFLLCPLLGPGRTSP